MKNYHPDEQTSKLVIQDYVSSSSNSITVSTTLIATCLL
jgi:hypothetical protein